MELIFQARVSVAGALVSQQEPQQFTTGSLPVLWNGTSNAISVNFLIGVPNDSGIIIDDTFYN